MDIQAFQKKCGDIVRNIDKKYGVKRTKELSFIQLTEEIGELAKEVNYTKLRGERVDEQNLKGEFADIVLQVAVLADLYGVDLEEAVDYKLVELKKRHGEVI